MCVYYGFPPNFKLEKEIIDRRIAILKEEGIEFYTNINVGINYSVEKLKEFDLAWSLRTHNS